MVIEGTDKPQTVLDIGTGSGLFAEQFATCGLTALGLDVYPEMLITARHFVTAGAFQAGSAEKKPFSDHIFNIGFFGLLLQKTDAPLWFERSTPRCNQTSYYYGMTIWLQSFDPPLEDRLAYENVDFSARQAGFNVINQIRLKHLVLYLLDN